MVAVAIRKDQAIDKAPNLMVDLEGAVNRRIKRISDTWVHLTLTALQLVSLLQRARLKTLSRDSLILKLK